MIRFERLFTIDVDQAWLRNQPSYRSRIPTFQLVRISTNDQWDIRPLPRSTPGGWMDPDASLPSSSLTMDQMRRIVSIRAKIRCFQFVKKMLAIFIVTSKSHSYSRIKCERFINDPSIHPRGSITVETSLSRIERKLNLSRKIRPIETIFKFPS